MSTADTPHSNHKRRTRVKEERKAQKLGRVRSGWNRISARKTREVVDLIRGKSVNEAIGILRVCTRKAALPTLKALKSAMANATETKKMDLDSLYVKEARVEEGPTLRRMLPRARGRADRIRKRTSHTIIVLAERK
ncbi:MAG: 50S ribosomal protein L22 [Candidatus Riflebacteria bacterium]|nr:50S ribosomal protein L22 [Candidatus Riflebacteria bacterium]